MHTLERKHDPADRSSVQHILHGLLLCTSERSTPFLSQQLFYLCPSLSQHQTSFGLCWSFTLSSTSLQFHSPLSQYTWTVHGQVITIYDNMKDFFIYRTKSFMDMSHTYVYTGLGFLRALRLMSVPDILQYLNILKTSTSIR